MPCSDLFIYFTLTLGTKMGNIIGVRLTIVVALACKYISYALLLFIPNYYIVLIAMCLFGIGNGLGNLTYMKNSWKYFPKSQGLVNGIILGGAGISSSVLTPLADYFIINPDKEKANEDTGLYPKEVGDRVLFMDGGKVLEENTPEEIFTNPKGDRLKSFLSKVLV